MAIAAQMKTMHDMNGLKKKKCLLTQLICLLPLPTAEPLIFHHSKIMS